MCIPYMCIPYSHKLDAMPNILFILHVRADTHVVQEQPLFKTGISFC